MNKTKKIAIGAAAGLTSLGIGLGVSSMAMAEPTPTPSGSASASGNPSTGSSEAGGRAEGRHKGHRGGPGVKGVADKAAFAEKLGVEKAALKTALQEIRAERKADTPKTKPSEKPTAEERQTAKEARQGELAKALAEKLGMDEAKVVQALTDLDAERTAEHQARFKSRLDKAVTDGELTQAEADAVQKAFDAGVIGGPGPR